MECVSSSSILYDLRYCFNLNLNTLYVVRFGLSPSYCGNFGLCFNLLLFATSRVLVTGVLLDLLFFSSSIGRFVAVDGGYPAFLLITTNQTRSSIINE